jgi:peptidoglycan/LPS O-acetylase OafA/YrhL
MNSPNEHRLHSLDAVRGFALLLGVAFHAALSFMPGWPPGIWAMVDNSPSPFLSDAAFVAHLFRMTLFFFIAGFFARLMHQKLGTAGFWKNRLTRIAVPLIIGWAVLYPAIGAVWTAGLTKVFGGNLPPMPEMPKTFGTFPVTHLWFLYQLLQLYVITLLVRAVIARVDGSQKFRCFVDSMLSSALRIPLVVFLLAIPVALALMSLPMWFYWAGIPTPDMTLIPQVAPVVGYGVAFAFGWLVHRSGSALASIAKYWLLNLVVGAAAAAWLLLSLHATFMAPPGFPANPFEIASGGLLTKSGFALMFGVAAWGIALGLTGAALRFLSGYSPVRRYIADASYWVYLAHLPVVAALQVWVGIGRYPGPSSSR